MDGGPYPFAKNGRHTVRLVCDMGELNVNYWQYHADIPIGVNINLKSTANNNWVSVSGANSNLIANAASPGTAELFTVIDASAGYGHGHVALQAITNGLLSRPTQQRYLIGRGWSFGRAVANFPMDG